MQTLELPDWIPPCVGVEAKRIRAAVDCDFEEQLIIHLTSDERMKKVWRVLYRPHARKRDHFRYPARVLSATKKAKGNAHDRQEIQDRAAVSFFLSAYYYAYDLDQISVLSDSRIEALKAPFNKIAQQLLELAENLRAIGMRNEAEDLKNIAAKVKNGWPDHGWPHDPYVEIWKTGRVRTRNIGIRRGDFGQLLDAQNLRRYVAQLANKSSMLFGKKLYGTLATIANVAFELEGSCIIIGEQVRQILRSPPVPFVVPPWRAHHSKLP